jgi:hypothetical protein
MLDLQQMYDRVAKHLLKQNKKAIYVENEQKLPKMMYVTPDGLKCAVGCLFALGMYSPDMEGYAFKGVDTWKQHADNDGLVKMRDALKAGGVYVSDEMVMRLLTDLQHVHDHHEPNFWPQRLLAVARTWRLASLVVDIHLARVRELEGP